MKQHNYWRKIWITFLTDKSAQCEQQIVTNYNSLTAFSLVEDSWNIILMKMICNSYIHTNLGPLVFLYDPFN